MIRLASMRYACDCCGYKTLDAPGFASDQICPVCFWEHTNPDQDYWNGSNGISLAEAQANCARYGAAGEAFVDSVRPPTVDEARDLDWLPWDQAKARDAARVIAHFRRAFAGVTLDGGTSLFDAEMIDDYGCDSSRNDPIRHLPYTTWEALPGVLLDSFRPTSFFDARGVRFHLPAYMARAVEDGDDIVVQWVTPSKGELADWWAEKFSLITPEQGRAIIDFLEFVQRYCEWTFYEDTRVAAAYWRARVEGS